MIRDRLCVRNTSLKIWAPQLFDINFQTPSDLCNFVINGAWDDPRYATRVHHEVMRKCSSVHNARRMCTHTSRKATFVWSTILGLIILWRHASLLHFGTFIACGIKLHLYFKCKSNCTIVFHLILFLNEHWIYLYNQCKAR